MSEQVAVPLSALAKHEGWWHLDGFEDEASLRRQYNLIRLLRREREHEDTEYIGRDWTAQEATNLLIRRRCERRRKNGESWSRIAESLDMNQKTLWRHRKSIFSDDHPYHPDNRTNRLDQK